jgi:cobalt transporter subunit CbtA
MAVFRRLLYAALCAGLTAGAFAALAHQVATVPLILEAETYEQAAPHAHATPGAGAPRQEAAAWAPEDGAERTAFTLAADLLAGIGFALLLAAGLALRGGPVGWRDGLFWGLAGFAAFTLAPGLGLPPLLPGSEAAPLVQRQLWWLATVGCTGVALGLLAFTRAPLYAGLAAGLLLLPHLYGAPQPVEAAALAPPLLAHRFVVAATLASFVFWAVLGAATGAFFRYFEQRAG